MTAPGGDPFARQTLIAGWDQARLTRARVLVAGVGALGNASVVDLALTGVGQLLLADFDAVETSNLSRAVLFRRGDEGRRKVAVAAERLRLLALAPGATILPLDTDVAWELGRGVYRRVDLVLGCVDSSEARAAVGRAAWALGVPAVFGGLHGHDGGVLVQGAGTGPCVACSFSAGEWAEWSRRYSCHQVRHPGAAAGRIPATQIAATLVSALMVQEGLRLLHGDGRALGTRLFLAGRVPLIERVSQRRHPRCPFHARIAPVEERPDLTATMPAGEAVERLSGDAGRPVTLALGRAFLLGARCQGCGTALRLWRPRHRTRTDDLVCDGCRPEGRALARDPEIQAVREIGPTSDRAVLDRPLEALGVPALDLLEVREAAGSRWVELTGDLPRVLPGWPAGLVGSGP